MKIEKKNSIFSMSKNNKIAARVKAPCHLSFESHDCFSGQICSSTMSIEKLDFSKVNPATGPVYIENARPGDALAVHIKDIRVNSPGVVVTISGAGVLPDRIKGKTSICHIFDEYFDFHGLRLPLNPMIGVIGVAPEGEGISCGIPGIHGGNMDSSAIMQGSVLYLPVFVEGAFLAMGDLHAAMGDGEVGVSGLEVSGEVDVSLSLIEKMKIPCPLVKTRDELAFLASSETLDEAVSLSTLYMHDFLIAHSKLNADHALQLMSLCGQARISQVVDPLKTARFCLPLEVLKKLGLALAF